ncbi:MAG: hypothetical protein ACLQF1_19310 [Methyloceanibacter sp.]
MVSIEKLAKLGNLGGVMVSLMISVQDFALANHAMEGWKTEENPNLKSRKIGARMYFLRLQMSHIFEAFEIITKKIEKSADLKAAIAACDPQTRSSYQVLLDFLETADYDRLLRIRNNLGFHYDTKVAQKALVRLEKRQKRRRRNGKYVQDQYALTLGNNGMDWHFELTEAVKQLKTISSFTKFFDLPEIDDPAELLAKSDEIVMSIFSIALVLADFVGHFVKHHAKA